MRRQYFVLSVMSIAVIVMAAVLSGFAGLEIFERIFAGVDPFLVIASFVIVGGLSLVFVARWGAFRICSATGTGRTIVRSALLATLFAIAVIVADLVWRYPENINVPLPLSLVFYPAIAYTAEMAFHVIPLAALVLIIGLRAGPRMPHGVSWLLLFIAALLEPAFQLGLETKPLSATGIYTAIHVFAINLCQLYLFRRYDFVSMLSFRLAYYAWWHVTWGFLRLHLLFGTAAG